MTSRAFFSLVLNNAASLMTIIIKSYIIIIILCSCFSIVHVLDQSHCLIFVLSIIFDKDIHHTICQHSVMLNTIMD